MFFARLFLGVILLLGLQARAGEVPTPAAQEQLIKVTAKRFEYSPSVIQVKLNVPVVLELSTLDRVHGFEVPDLALRGEIKPGEVTKIRFVPDKIGTFAFHCNVFCGSGHEDMSGQIVVTK